MRTFHPQTSDQQNQELGNNLTHRCFNVARKARGETHGCFTKNEPRAVPAVNSQVANNGLRFLLSPELPGSAVDCCVTATIFAHKKEWWKEGEAASPPLAVALQTVHKIQHQIQLRLYTTSSPTANILNVKPFFQTTLPKKETVSLKK